MRSDLQITYLTPHTKSWFDYRRNGIGGSECGDICGLVKPEYNRTIYIYHNKVNDYPTEIPDNPKMFFGRYLEDSIANLWRYWDGTDTGFMENYKNDRIVRDCRRVNGIIVNPKYPWLFGSVDRLINVKNGINLLTGEALKNEGVLEIKNMSYNAARVWEDKIPPSFIAQLHAYMIILEVEYAELVTLIDGNTFSVTPFNRDDNLCESIINVTKSFWHNRILPAKQAFAKKQEAERQGNFRVIEECEAVIQQHEPEPDSSQAYFDFMNKQFLKERESMPGTMELFELCKQDKMLLGLNNIIDERRNLVKNTLIKALSDKGAEMINFDSLGSYKFSERKGSKNRVPMNGIKDKPSDDILLREFNKLDLDY